MAYIGLTPTIQNLATSSQQLSGDGTTKQFTLQQSVGKASDIIVAVGSTLQIPNTDYTASATSVIFTNAPTSGTNNISVSYVGGALNTVYLSANSFPVGTTTAPSINAVTAASTGIYWPSINSLAVSVSGNTRVTVSDAAQGLATSTTTGALRVVGGVGITGDGYFGGVIRASGTTDSTNSTTGALVVSGGVGIAKSVNVLGSMVISGGLTVAGAFNTTSTNSLVVNTPFLFLANTNVSDSVDIGTIGTYQGVDSVQRYTGLFRAQSDGTYRLFTNLTNQPSTLVDKGNVSFRHADLWLGNANVTSTVSSTTSTTGALTVWGGVGARGALYLNSVNNAIAIGNGGTSGTGSIGASGAIFGAFWGTTANFNSTVTVNSTAQSIAIANGGTSGSGDIGASGATFGTVWAKATSAQYADLAENYLGDSQADTGTVMLFGGEWEVTECNDDMSPRVAGVVSTNPAHLMNNGLIEDPDRNKYVVTIALTGRVPCKVTGTVRKGDLMVSAGNGRARAEANPVMGSVIGKALENFDELEGIIEVVVGRV